MRRRKGVNWRILSWYITKFSEQTLKEICSKEHQTARKFRREVLDEKDHVRYNFKSTKVKSVPNFYFAIESK